MKRTPLKRRKAIARKPPRRLKSAKADAKYLARVRELPCIARCPFREACEICRPCSSRVEAHHAGRRGVGQKCHDNEAVPLCSRHHREFTDHCGMFRGFTMAERRDMQVADAIAVCLQHQAKDRVGQLIPKCTPAMVYHHVTRMCERAGVTVVCPHGLRGTHATLAAGRGATSTLLMEALGHTSIAVTQRHYIQAGTMEGARAGEVQRQLMRPIDVAPEEK